MVQRDVEAPLAGLHGRAAPAATAAAEQVAKDVAEGIGKAALEERKAHPRRKLVGLAIASNEAASHGDGIYLGRAKVGEITSTVRSPVLGTQIALARVDVAYSALETALQVGQLDGHRKRLDARVVAFPHYDPTKARVRA